MNDTDILNYVIDNYASHFIDEATVRSSTRDEVRRAVREKFKSKMKKKATPSEKEIHDWANKLCERYAEGIAHWEWDTLIEKSPFHDYLSKSLKMQRKVVLPEEKSILSVCGGYELTFFYAPSYV